MPDANETGSCACSERSSFQTQLTLPGTSRPWRTEKPPEDGSPSDRNASLCVTVLRKL